MSDQTFDRQRFADLLPFYVNQTLTEPDQAWMEVYLSSHPGAQVLLDFEVALRDTCQNTVSKVPEDHRVAKLMEALHQARHKLTLKKEFRH